MSTQSIIRLFCLSFFLIASATVRAGVPGLDLRQHNPSVLELVQRLVAAGLRFESPQSSHIEAQRLEVGDGGSSFEFAYKNWKSHGVGNYFYNKAEGIYTIAGTTKAYITLEWNATDGELTIQLWRLEGIDRREDLVLNFSDLKITHKGSIHDGKFGLYANAIEGEDKAIDQVKRAMFKDDVAEFKASLSNPLSTVYGPMYAMFDRDLLPLPHYVLANNRVDLYDLLESEGLLDVVWHNYSADGASVISAAASGLEAEHFETFITKLERDHDRSRFQTMLRSRDRLGQTALHYAARSAEGGGIKIKKLVALGLLLEDTDYHGVKPVDVAIQTVNADALAELLADKDQRDRILRLYSAKLEKKKAEAVALAAALNATDVATLIPVKHQISISLNDFITLGARGRRDYTLETAARATTLAQQRYNSLRGNPRLQKVFQGRQSRKFITWSTHQPGNPRDLHDVIVSIALLNPGDYPNFPDETTPLASLVLYYQFLKSRMTLHELNSTVIPWHERLIQDLESL